MLQKVANVVASVIYIVNKIKCVDIGRKRQRRMLAKLRGETAELRSETSRWCAVSWDERICKTCDAGEVEDLEHFLLCCACMVEERRQMEKLTVDG